MSCMVGKPVKPSLVSGEPRPEMRAMEGSDAGIRNAFDAAEGLELHSAPAGYPANRSRLALVLRALNRGRASRDVRSTGPQ